MRSRATVAHRGAVVPTMVFLSRYVVGGVARNMQGNEHLALLPIPFQLPVVGAQEKEGREARVVAGGRVRPQCRHQQHGQDQSPRRPAAALHAAALRAAARPARSLIQFWSHPHGRATRREGEPAAGSSQAAPGNRARREVGGRPRLPKLLWASGARARGRSRGRGELVVRLRAPPPVCATPLGRAWESARPLHTFLKPRAPPPPSPRRRHTCPSRAPAPAPVPAPRAPLAPRAAPGSHAYPALVPLGPKGQGCSVAAKRQVTTDGQADGLPGEAKPWARSCPSARMRGEAEGRGDRAVLCLRWLLPAPLEARRPAAPAASTCPDDPPARGPEPRRCPARTLSSQASQPRRCPPPGSSSAARLTGRPWGCHLEWCGARLSGCLAVGTRQARFARLCCDALLPDS